MSRLGAGLLRAREMREFPYRRPWLFALPVAVIVGLLPILKPHPRGHHPVGTAILIFLGILLVMRWLVSQTPGARRRAKDE
jgi:hypothetical protein